MYLLPTTPVGRGFLMVFNRLPTISQPIADWTGCGPIINSVSRIYSSRQPYMYGPTGFYKSLKGCQSSLRTSAINRQPVDNQLANKCRFKFSWSFRGFGRQWLPVVVRNHRFYWLVRNVSWKFAKFHGLLEVGNRSLPLCDCSLI